jgi:hypothetical protein
VRRITWAHELGHTLYPADQKEWGEVAKWANPFVEPRDREEGPTKYAKRQPYKAEEDFAESFMVTVLYAGKGLGARRKAFFAKHSELHTQGAQRDAAVAESVSISPGSNPASGAGAPWPAAATVK